jgi:aspartyl/asparaginyl-tRNA synthetase
MSCHVVSYILSDYNRPSLTVVLAVAKTKLSLEYLRSIMHFRIRSNTIASVTRIRNCLASATHRFFQVSVELAIYSSILAAVRQGYIP